jgi:dTMP kinase
MVPSPHPLPHGLVIMFEGIDGTGKTTQLSLVQKALEQAGWPVLSTRNLGGTPIGEALREVILSPVERPPMTDFYTSLAIQEPLLNMIDAARKEGKIILMDRGPLSLAAYQVYGSDILEVDGWHYVASGMERLQPEAVILYDIAVIETALGRKHSEKPDYFESKSQNYFQRVAKGYHIAAQRYPVVTTIDADQSIDAVQEQTMAVIIQLLKPKA